MSTETLTEEALRTMFCERGLTYSEIAAQFEGVTRNMVAGRISRLGLAREPGKDARSRVSRQVAQARKRGAYIGPKEKAEREINDRRDIDILHDLAEGHSQNATAEHWGVSQTYVHHLAKAAREAA